MSNKINRVLLKIPHLEFDGNINYYAVKSGKAFYYAYLSVSYGYRAELLKKSIGR